MDNFESMERRIIHTDILIVGGGTAGCMAAMEAREHDPNVSITIMEKAHIDRSGCLASGMNAINAYLNPGETPESFTRFVRYDAMGLIREDLVLSQAREFEKAVKKVENLGLPIEKDKNGTYRARGRWNIKINGESLKPIIADGARSTGAEILNRVAATNLLTEGQRVIGATGLGIHDSKFYAVFAKATIVATGGASGIYKPNNNGDAHHKMWYSPFNTGAGYAIGLRAGAEMTSFEMRFIALRTKEIISPTGTLALGFGAAQVNAKNEKFMQTRYSDLGGERAPTPIRVYAPTKELQEGRGPCYMDTTHLSKDEVYNLKQAFLDMYPGIVLYWGANRIDPSKEKIEICGTEPYIMGGHCQAGYWIDEERKTTLDGLYAAGDVAGGAPYKFVSGCWAEGMIAARSAVKYIKNIANIQINERLVLTEQEKSFKPLRRFEIEKEGVTPEEMETRVQKVMDEYAGGISTYYEINEEKLLVAREKIEQVRKQIPYLIAKDLHELNLAHETIDKIDVARVLIEHLIYRKETRWPGYQTRLDYTKRNDTNWLKFVNSKLNKDTGEIVMNTRAYNQIVSGDRYEPAL